jgi:small subunit ribosomal protein S2
VLLVGTKRQARDAVRSAAERTGMHYVVERWLGGTLTNFRTIRSRLQRLEELENLMSGPQWENYSKKMKATLTRELDKMQLNLRGIRNMTRLPGALVVVDVRREVNALREAATLKIPTVCLIDTDSDPDFVSIPIPGNDDAMRAINLVMDKIADAVEEGKRARPERPVRGEEAAEGEGERGGRRRRGPRGRVEAQAAMAEGEVGAGGTAVAATDAPQEAPAAGEVSA